MKGGPSQDGTRRANRPFGEAPLYSKLRPSLTEKLISEGWVATPTPASSALEVGIGAVVQDDEAGVHVMGLVGGVDPHRVGVAARVVVRLEHGDVVALVEQVGAHEPGHARADDRDCGSSRVGPGSQRRAGQGGAAREGQRAPAGATRDESPAARVAPRSARSPAAVPISQGRRPPPRLAAHAAPAASAMSRAPRPRSAMCTGRCPATGPSQLSPTDPGLRGARFRTPYVRPRTRW